jgi:hypothetical protein
MNLIKTSLIALVITLIIAACNQTYVAQNFNEKTATHKLVAVMPVEVIYTGNLPAKLTPDLKKQLEELESKAFQISFFNQILKKANSKGGYRVDFQPTETTLNLLKNNNISIQDSWTKDPTQLCKILGVDAIVRTRVQKNRLMSELASYGITVGKEVVDIILEEVKKNGGKAGEQIGKVGDVANPTNTTNPALNGKTYTIEAGSSLLDGKSGTVLWRVSQQAQADYEYTDEMIIDGVSRKCAKNFPYGVK